MKRYVKDRFHNAKLVCTDPEITCEINTTQKSPGSKIIEHYNLKCQPMLDLHINCIFYMT